MTGPCIITGICVLAWRNKFNAQQKTEMHTLNDEYENFVNAHLEEAAEYIPTK